MALVTYVGDRNFKPDHRDATTLRGYEFLLDEPIEITNEADLVKFRNNRFFEVLEDGNPGDSDPASSESAPKVGRSGSRSGKSAV